MFQYFSPLSLSRSKGRKEDGLDQADNYADIMDKEDMIGRISRRNDRMGR